MEPWLQQWLTLPETQARLARAKSTGVLTFDEIIATIPPEPLVDKFVAAAELVHERYGIAPLDGNVAENSNSRP